MTLAVHSVLVTGGGSGIGAALAEELARRGCRVVISGRRPEPLERVAEESPLIEVCVGDVTDAGHRAELAAALAITPAPRAIVHAAGHFQVGLLDVLTVGEWRRSSNGPTDRCRSARSSPGWSTPTWCAAS